MTEGFKSLSVKTEHLAEMKAYYKFISQKFFDKSDSDARHRILEAIENWRHV